MSSTEDRVASYNNVLTNMAITREVSGIYFDLSHEQSMALGNLAYTNEIMINTWDGEAGVSFQGLASTIENELLRTIRYDVNSAEVTSQQADNFENLDEDRANSINVNTASDSSSEASSEASSDEEGG